MDEPFVSIDDNLSPKMKGLRAKAQLIADAATHEDHAEADRIRAAGTGLRRETITPATAALLVLRHNKVNRKLVLSKVNDFATMMTEGDFKEHHQGIAFYPDGTLADGQHRLFAATLADFTLRIPVDSDFNKDSNGAIDRSNKRTAGQAAEMEGIADAEEKMAVGKAVLDVAHTILHGVRPRFSDYHLIREVRKIEGELETAIRYGKASTKNITSPSLREREACIVAGILLHHKWDSSRVTGFLAALQQGIATYSDAPTLVCSRRLLQAQDASTKKNQLNQRERIAYVLKAAKLWAQNVGVSKLNWDERKEGMPNPSLELEALVAAE